MFSIRTDGDQGRDGLPIARTEKGLAYEQFLKKTQAILSGAKATTDPDVIAANEEILELKTRPGEVHQDEVLTNLSVQYANDEFIGNRLMPVVKTNGSLSAAYFEYNKRDRFAYPDDDMSDRTTANELNQGRSKKTLALTPRSLKEYLDQLTIQNQSAPLNELVDVQQNVLEGMAFRRELRQAAILCSSASYGSNTVALSAGDRWDGPSGGNPGAVVDAATKAIWRGRGPAKTVGFVSLDVHNVLKRHPLILDQFKYAGNRPGFATREMLREYFELDEYLVGAARKDTANEGQTASYGRIWSNVFGIVRVATSPSTRNAVFGFTFQDLDTQTDLFWEPTYGTKGAYMVRSSHSDQEKVIAPDTGFLITTPIG